MKPKSGGPRERGCFRTMAHPLRSESAEVQPPSKLAQAVAAVVIALFWCINSITAAVGITTLATAVGAATSAAEAGDKQRRRRKRGRRRHRRRRGDKWEWYWAPYWYWEDPYDR